MTTDELTKIVRKAVRTEMAAILGRDAALADGRRKMLTAAECLAKYGVGNDTLTSLRTNKQVHAKLSPGHGRGGRVWRYSAADVEAAIGAKS